MYAVLHPDLLSSMVIACLYHKQNKRT